MHILRNAAALALICASFHISAQDPWLHIYYEKGQQYNAYDMSEVLEITFDETTSTMSVNTADNQTRTISTKDFERFVIGPNVPVLRITTNEYCSEVPSKDYFLDGTITLDGRGVAKNLPTSPMQIRGRGNSTWTYSKKPYRIKFAEKTKMVLPKKAKNFVLLANHIDPAMMRNFVAYKFGEYIDMPNINHTYPVDVYFNDIYKGSYMLTEKTGFNSASVDLSKEDEPNSILFELDTYYAEADEHPFNSESFSNDNYYSLPVRIKDPDAPEDYEEMINWELKWQDDFNEFMAVIATGDLDKIYEACDLDALVRYVMVNNIACNQELDHPKSVLLWKTEGGKYNFGPCWDFDWAFGYQPTYGSSSSYQSYRNPLLGKRGWNPESGGPFFYALCGNERFMERFREVWDEFYQNHLDEFWADFDAYAELLRPSANLQGLTRSDYQNFDSNVNALRSWVANRIEFINSDAHMALWQDGMFE